MRKLGRGRLGRIAGVVFGLGLVLSTAPAASAAMWYVLPDDSATVAVGGTADYTAQVGTWLNSGTRYYQVAKRDPVNDGGALGLSLTSECAPIGSWDDGTIDFSLATTVGTTVPGNFSVRLRVIEYSNATCSTATGQTYDFRQDLTVRTTVFVVANDQAVNVGAPAPAYTYVMHLNSPTGSVWTHAPGPGYTAPTCTSTYTPATPASSSPLPITCTGGSHSNTFFVGVAGSLTINRLTPAFAFAPIDDKTVGDPDFSVAGNVTLDADNTGAVTFHEVAGSTGCEVSSEGSIRITGAGTCTVEASVVATEKYAAAGPLSQSFDIVEPEATATPTATATATATATPTDSGSEEVAGATAQPTQAITPAPTNTSSDAPGSATPIFALLICLAFGGLGLLTITAQRRSIRN